MPSQPLRRTRRNHGFACAIALAASATLLAACGGVSKRPSVDAASPVPIAPRLAAFEMQPNRANWLSLHAALLRGPIAPETESRLVEILANDEVPREIFAAAAVDLATLDWGGAMQWVERTNVAARSDPSPRGTRAVANSSRLAWLMLTLRANYANDPVDLTRTDLRAGPPSMGQAMNLQRVDFSHSELAGTTWRSTNLTDALFNGAVVAGTLRCVDCTFGTLQYRGTAVLSDGKWLSR